MVEEGWTAIEMHTLTVGGVTWSLLEQFAKKSHLKDDESPHQAGTSCFPVQGVGKNDG